MQLQTTPYRWLGLGLRTLAALALLGSTLVAPLTPVARAQETEESEVTEESGETEAAPEGGESLPEPAMEPLFLPEAAAPAPEVVVVPLGPTLPSFAGAPGPDGWSAGPGAVGSPRLRGSVDQPTANALLQQGESLRVRGWAANFDDPALTGIVEVKVYDGAVANEKLLATAEFGRPRPDVANLFGDGRLGSTGFEASVPTANLATGSHTLVVVVRTRDNGSWQRSVPFSVMGNVRRARGEFVYATHVANPREDAHLAAAAGFTHMSAYVSWAKVEPRKDHFLFETTNEWGQTTANDLTNVVEAAEEAGLKLILRVDDPPQWAGGKPNRVNPRDMNDYVNAVVRYARGTVEYIEILNEPNLPLEWGGAPDPARYAQLLREAYTGAKRADPNVKVVAAAVSQRTGGLGGTMEDVDWLDGLYRAGAKDTFDLMGLHAYPGAYAPTEGAECTPLCFRNVELYRAVMERHGDGGKKALITEFGVLEQTATDLGAYDWMELPAAQRAENLVQTLQLAASYPWIVGAATFNLDYATTSWVAPNTAPYWFSLLNPDRSPRAAYRAFKEARANGTLP